METKQYSVDVATASESAEGISIEALEHLVRVLDRSDVSEIEVKRVEEGTRLVLRKVVASESPVQGEVPLALPVREEVDVARGEKKPHVIVAPVVGIFHPWAKPRGKALVTVGDRVKLGQLVGAIQSLNVIYEVETTVAGRVAEILVHDGQPVEYGQQLMLIESVEEA